jgi:hypothetical protein
MNYITLFWADTVIFGKRKFTIKTFYEGVKNITSNNKS